MSASGADPRRISTIASSALWSPDGQWVVFVAEAAFNLIRPDCTGRVRLVIDEWLSYLNWSADSQEIAFTFSPGPSNTNIAIVGLDGTRETVVMDFGNDIWPQMRPRRP